MSDLEVRIRTACDAGAWERAATLAIEGYGSELLGYLVALARNASDADDVFGAVCESLWVSLPKFRWESSFRTYAYTIARHAFLKQVRGLRTPTTGLSSPSVEQVAARVRSQTATFLRTETRDKVAELRAQLEPDDQTLLILRINRQLPWRDIARIMSDDELDDAALRRQTAALRKRFERLKDDLRERLER